MDKVKMRVTIVYEYEANLAHYGDNPTPERIAEIDNNADMALIAAEEGEMTITAVDAQP